jgi:hypothetical protein
MLVWKILLGRGRVPSHTGHNVAAGLGPCERVRAALTDGHGTTRAVLHPVLLRSRQ